MFINADVEHIVFDSVYPDERAMTFFDEAHIAVVWCQDEQTLPAN